MSDNALRKQPDPTSGFDTEGSSPRADTDLWAAFHAAQDAESSGGSGSAPQTSEQLPADDGVVEPRPLRQQFQEREGGEPRPTDPTSAFGAAPLPSRSAEADGTSNHELPPGEGTVDLRPLRIRFQEEEH
ncbi:hypothetical protein ACFXAE_12855 [Streptomyces sp. NPDC059454]|jgi:hypothetical protein|uniref:hypothetical protein n=1 Tax=Streptomyces sp. NPDC059454 TaxID=3346836 RepID=UPI00367FED39